jgi:cobalt-zinc-cadmium efflux system membrane fusion protein
MRASILLLTLSIAGAVLGACSSAPDAGSAAKAPAPAPGPASGSATAPPTVHLSDSQIGAIQVGAVTMRAFEAEKEEVGSIDLNENLAVPVYSPYQGKVLETFADLGDTVKRGEVLFTIDSPDFIQAEASLIAAAASLDQTSSALERARKLYADQAIDQNDFETALANLKAAEGNLRAAKQSVAVFGKTSAEIEHIVASRDVEHALVVRSPVSGRVTARNAAPGLLAQPGNPPAQFTVADLSTVWLVANVAESDVPALQLGQEMSVRVVAYPDEVFKGRVSALGTVLDPNTRRLMVRASVSDPKHELLPGMYGRFVIRTGSPVQSPAVPLNAVVREGDGTMSVWVTGADRHRFERREVTLGLQADGFRQILSGLKAGELVATDGAIFLSNIAYGGAT